MLFLKRVTDLEFGCLEREASGRTFCLEVLLGRIEWSSDSEYTAEKGIELLISKLVVGEAGGELVIDLV